MVGIEQNQGLTAFVPIIERFAREHNLSGAKAASDGADHLKIDRLVVVMAYRSQAEAPLLAWLISKVPEQEPPQARQPEHDECAVCLSIH